MNINLATLPLPVYANTSARAQRRLRIGNLNPDRHAERSFLRVVERLEPDSMPPSFDSIASAARQLNQIFANKHRAPCIQMRLRCLAAMKAMSQDSGWSLQEDQRQPIRWIADYATGKHRLVPDHVPVIGGLDDAILVDIAWPSLSFELDDFLSFRRLRAKEAQLRGLHPRKFGFTREDWLQARAAEAALLQRARRRVGYCYGATPAPALFRFHG